MNKEDVELFGANCVLAVWTAKSPLQRTGFSFP